MTTPDRSTPAMPRNEAAEELRKARPSGWAQDWWEDRIDAALREQTRITVDELADKLLEGQQQQGGPVPTDSREDAVRYATWLLESVCPLIEGTAE